MKCTLFDTLNSRWILSISVFSLTLLAKSASYYVSSEGDNSADGLSPKTAWRTIARVNAQPIMPGDSIYLEGGAVFSGGLRLGLADARLPVRITSFGGGRAIINGGNERALWAWGAGGIHIHGVKFVGGGIEPVIDISNSLYLGEGSNYILEDVDVSGGHPAGISITCDAIFGLSDISITNTRVHHNSNGILIGSGITPAPLIKNLYMRGVEADHNDATIPPMGGIGIALSNVSGCLIERSSIHENGAQTNQPGVSGLLVYDSDHLVVQNNEVYGNTDPERIDGQGLAFVGVTNVVVRYNYCRDNYNGGIVFTNDFPFLRANNNIQIYYNVLENNHIGMALSQVNYNVSTFNNTIFSALIPGRTFTCPLLIDSIGNNLDFFNNIFYTRDGQPVIMVDRETVLNCSIQFQNNIYRAEGIHPEFSTYIIYANEGFYHMQDFRNITGQEMNELGELLGSSDDPLLVNAGAGGIIGDPKLLHTLSAYQLRKESPFRDAGQDVFTLHGLDHVPYDFYGNPLPLSGNFSIGANYFPTP